MFFRFRWLLDFRQSRKGAVIEVGFNILISLVLVIRYGLVGVAIGTLIAIILRTIEIIIYTSKNILNRKVLYAVKRIATVIIECVLIILIINIVPKINVINYMSWILYGLIVFAVSSIIVISINSIFYKDNFKNIVKHMKILARNKKDLF